MAPSMSDDHDADPATDPVQLGLEQFQRAALDAIRAGRAMLDAAESVLQDPKAAESVVRSVGSVARTATEAVSGFATGRWASARPGGPPQDETQDQDDEDGEPPDGFERITID